MQNLIQQAILLAMTVHYGETRKGDGKTPYVLHPLEVGIILSHYTTSETLITAAILHDVLETGKVKAAELREKFGNEVADLVEILTENASIAAWAERKEENLKRLKDAPVAYIIKAVDALANMRDLFVVVTTLGESVWKKFNSTRDMKFQYFARILGDIRSEMPVDLLEKYVSALKDLQYAHLVTSGTSAEIGFQA